MRESSDSEVLARIERPLLEFLSQMRAGKPPNEALFKEALLAIREAADVWKERDAIPRPAVALFVDSTHVMSSSYEFFSAETKEKMAELASQLNDAIRDLIYG